jgi:predicted ArsR family transcriptional regulator
MLTSISAARTLADLHGFEAISNMLEDAWNAALAEQTKIMQRESATEKARLKAA